MSGREKGGEWRGLLGNVFRALSSSHPADFAQAPCVRRSSWRCSGGGEDLAAVDNEGGPWAPGREVVCVAFATPSLW